jgi:deoxycytidine triphosphate deaminase
MLTGKKIRECVENGSITIDPFNPENCNPNSYDVTLGDKYAVVRPNVPTDHRIQMWYASDVEYRELVDGSIALLPGFAYLGHTVERVGSNFYVPVLHGRSSVARHGLMVHYAGLGDIGWYGQYVLELVNMTAYPMYIKPGTRIAQLSFEPVEGEITLYDSTYQNQTGIRAGKALFGQK